MCACTCIGGEICNFRRVMDNSKIFISPLCLSLPNARNVPSLVRRGCPCPQGVLRKGVWEATSLKLLSCFRWCSPSHYTSPKLPYRIRGREGDVADEEGLGGIALWGGHHTHRALLCQIHVQHLGLTWHDWDKLIKSSLSTVKPGKNTNSIRPGILFVFFGFVFVSWKEKNSGRILLVFFRLKARNTCRIRIRIFRKEFIPPENTFRSYFFSARQ